MQSLQPNFLFKLQWRLAYSIAIGARSASHVMVSGARHPLESGTLTLQHFSAQLIPNKLVRQVIVEL